MVQIPEIPERCNGKPTTDFDCCTSTNPCNVGEGDCDSDFECAVGLRCEYDNCLRDFPYAASNWKHDADCCVRSRGITKYQTLTNYPFDIM